MKKNETLKVGELYRVEEDMSLSINPNYVADWPILAGEFPTVYVEHGSIILLGRVQHKGDMTFYSFLLPNGKIGFAARHMDFYKYENRVFRMVQVK